MKSEWFLERSSKKSFLRVFLSEVWNGVVSNPSFFGKKSGIFGARISEVNTRIEGEKTHQSRGARSTNAVDGKKKLPVAGGGQQR